MFGHGCEEPIALVAAHPCDNLVLVCTHKINLTIIDLSKNRSLRSFGIPSIFSKEQMQLIKSNPIGLFFVDNLSCRTLQTIISSTIQNLPSENFICIVFAKCMVIFDYTCITCKFVSFDITAAYVAQAPDALVIADQTGNIYIYSFITNQMSSKIYTTSSPPSGLFVGASKGDPYGIIIPTQSGIEFVKPNNQAGPPTLNIEVGRNFAFDPYTSTLFSIVDKRSAKIFRCTSEKLQSIGECSFSSVSIQDSKPTNYNLQQIAPCYLPYSPINKPLFYALCDQNALFICSPSQVLMKVDFHDKFPPPQLRRLVGTYMGSHITNYTNLIIASEQFLFIIDIGAYLPNVVPSHPIPKSIKQNFHGDGLYTVLRHGELTVVIERTQRKFFVYDNKLLKKEIKNGTAYDVVIGPGRRFATINPSSQKDTWTLQIYDESLKPKDIEVKPKLPLVQRLISFGDYLAVVYAQDENGLSSNPQKKPKTGALAYRWSTFEPVTLEISGTTMAAYASGYVAIASPSMYALYKVGENNSLMHVANRNIAPISMKFHKDQLFVIANEGLYIDNMKTVNLVAIRFSHLISVDGKGTKIPMRATYITKIEDKTLTLCDNNGIETTIGMPEVPEVPAKQNKIDLLANQPDPFQKLKDAYKDASDEDKRHILILMLREVDWAAAKPYLQVSEKAGTESVLQEGGEALNEFNYMVQNEMELDL